MDVPSYAPALEMQAFLYQLPHSRIAEYPLERRDQSKLLVADIDSHRISHSRFSELPALLPADSMLVRNRSRVIAARIAMVKPTGGAVEVLLTKPLSPSLSPEVVLASSEACIWECLIGGKNVVPGMVLEVSELQFTATVLEREGTWGTVKLDWKGASTSRTLSSLLTVAGTLPLPPYIHRTADVLDSERYQTVYATQDGSVAAPTAGLHFTENVFNELQHKGITTEEVILHVGLGTFNPVSVENIRNHTMHTERIGVSAEMIEHYAHHCKNKQPWVTAVGTTSVRTLESLFILGAQLCLGADSLPANPHIEQWSAFNPEYATVSRAQAFSAFLYYVQKEKLEMLWADTSIMLAPGCRIASIDAIITNFHQPGNTLLLLIAAVCKGEFWREIYTAALDNEYRFLSYGDSSLLRISSAEPQR